MAQVFTSELVKHEGQEVTLKGWVANLRSSGKIWFLEFRDGAGFVQVIVDAAEVDKDSLKTMEVLTIESSAIIIGTVAKHPKKDEYEIKAKSVKLVAPSPEYPIGKKEHGPDFLLDNRHLWLRSSRQWAIQRIRNTIINTIYSHLNANGFIKIDAPILTPTSCEGTTTLFSIDYFGEPAYLTQSGQLYIEAAIFSHGRVFDFGPVFRAEKSKTRRHLTEFWMMDAEAAFVEHEENLKIQENLIATIVKAVLVNNKKELEILERDTTILQRVAPPFYRLTHKEAIAKLRERGSDIKDMDDLGADDETLLTELYDKPIFVEKYPAAVKAFYMKRDPADPKRVLNADLLAPEGYGEIIGGSQREDDYDALLARMKEEKLNIADFQWYLDLRKYGSVPHSGFGVGLERLVAWICGLKHVRESIPFPRLLNRLRP
ncbi:MAG: Asparagine-tRNA ligase [Parcubacteria group bacterium GW2011_GWD2_43_10]|uniref:Asparagine--tRNA ligase n=2 Tax=Candidatus Vebleniibacteriota TaxID=1817921 RepID=A0A1G2Q5W6_9BACT|nr:MAG: Asparagine-tRNA ligase [Parcubacteria group bacterium GW2011_GWD2_43_10]OHA55271.1 MAG: asparagine--tRNA ligase [Candidatus Veblenbacteria bacterium RIFOXYA2_FULL_43_9]OHA55280.1 MAG: asparagine--tRNA ligase [Candidatus Veblenbacteria bacterium RIFOXYB1_FULL_43_13]HBT92300.1 asparagine--tRNA ligase [Candidatus Veblenbacteria bacterium]